MVKKMVDFFRAYPLFILLLPFFFVLHGFNENFGFIEVKTVCLLILVYSASAIIIFIICFLFYKNWIKSSLLTTSLLSVYFFYGSVQDFLKTHLHFASRYRIL